MNKDIYFLKGSPVFPSLWSIAVRPRCFWQVCTPGQHSRSKQACWASQICSCSQSLLASLVLLLKEPVGNINFVYKHWNFPNLPGQSGYVQHVGDTFLCFCWGFPPAAGGGTNPTVVWYWGDWAYWRGQDHPGSCPCYNYELTTDWLVLSGQPHHRRPRAAGHSWWHHKWTIQDIYCIFYSIFISITIH